jgi:mono/diheme cytochrome c family protein
LRRRSLRRASLALLLVIGCSPQPLPDAGSPGAVAYAQQCGLCHPAHQPSLLTGAMWKVQVTRMAEMRARRGMPALTAGEEKLILEYLTSHAG